MSIRTVDQTIISPSTLPVISHNIQRTPAPPLYTTPNSHERPRSYSFLPDVERCNLRHLGKKDLRVRHRARLRPRRNGLGRRGTGGEEGGRGVEKKAVLGVRGDAVPRFGRQGSEVCEQRGDLHSTSDGEPRRPQDMGYAALNEPVPSTRGPLALSGPRSPPFYPPVSPLSPRVKFSHFLEGCGVKGKRHSVCVSVAD